MVNRGIAALLAGFAFTALLALSLNLSSLFFIIPATVLLAPGGILHGLFANVHGVFSPLPMLLMDSLIYSTLAYFVFRRWVRFEFSRRRLLPALAVAPVGLLVYLACVPAVSPIWPRGMSELTAQENSLGRGLPVGSSLDAARAFLRQRGIDTTEEEVVAERVVFQDVTIKLTAKPGERILFARIPTDAGQFPCGYRMDVYLIFDKSDILQSRRIQRFPICP